MVDKNENLFIVNEFHSFLASDLEEAMIISQSGNNYRLIYKEVVYDIVLFETNAQEKKWQLKVNGVNMVVEKQDKIDQLVNKLGFKSSSRHAIKEIVAPMPGLVLKVLVEEGAVISKGENLFVLEAMKMENIIKATGDGTITKIFVEKGDKVEKGQKLASL